jgi:hypothetical protein
MVVAAAKAAATGMAGVTAGNFLVIIIKIGGNGRVPPIFLHSLRLAGRFSASVDSARPLIRLLAHVVKTKIRYADFFSRAEPEARALASKAKRFPLRPK